ncbi:MAG TPA: TIGR02679 family protein [Acidimicrobiales bacterium]|nr:TIGR02679 family protein [Acidimicrobiales bacterium]
MSAALERPALRSLVEELARRLASGQVVSSVTIPDDCRPAAADLLGLERVPRSGQRLRIAPLLDALGLADLDALRVAVERVVGPLPQAGAERRAELERRTELWEWLAAEASRITLGGSLEEWVDAQRARGARGGVERRRRQLERALAVLRRLPADGLPLASLAADEAGGPHGLDRGRSLTGCVLDAVAVATGQPRPATAEEVRLLWESVGVVPDPLSSTVMALGLPGDESPLGLWLDAARQVGEPLVLTLANLRRWPRPPLAPGERAFVVENPSLLAEAAAAGVLGPPLICSSGRPTIAVVTLLRQLGAAGARLYQHADFDPAGVAITTWLQQHAGTTPWRMTAADYLSSVRPGDVTFGAVPLTPWDPRLCEAMAEWGTPVYEEEIRLTLLEAARAPDAGTSPSVQTT